MAVYLKRTKLQKFLIILIIFIVLSTIVFKNWRYVQEEDDNEQKLYSKTWWTNLLYKNKTKWRSFESRSEYHKGRLKMIHNQATIEKLEIQKNDEDQKDEKSIMADKYKIVHLDFKGAPPKMSYLMNLLPVIREAGANGLLIEYEDMFPFEGNLRNISAGNAYTRTQVEKFLELASSLKLEVIPLVQTFGHLEFVLKLSEFRHLRELDTFPQEICPAKEGSLELVKEMVKQVMQLHKTSRFIHIGCDEVFHISACSQCSRRNPRVVFAEHVKKVARWVRNHYPGVTPLIWDDMLRHWSPADLQASDLGEFVEPMVWVYIDDIHRLVPQFIWYMYKRTFPRLWAASAYKGAFGETEIIPDLGRHFENHLSWIRLMKHKGSANEVSPENFGGIVLTGWSRYDHFAVLSELLPVGTPSLMLNLVAVTANFQNNRPDPNPNVFNKWMRVLQCPNSIPTIDYEGLKIDRFQWVLGRCLFPGANLYTALTQYFYLKTRLDNMAAKMETNGWVSSYNIFYNYTSPWRVLEMFPDEGFAGRSLKKDISEFKKTMAQILTQYFDDFTVSEWLAQKVTSMEDKLDHIERTFEKLIQRRVWDRRPLLHKPKN